MNHPGGAIAGSGTIDMATDTNSNNPSTGSANDVMMLFVPSTKEMTILCLDFFRNTVLRNNYVSREHQSKEEIHHEQYISIACWALQQSLNVTANSATSVIGDIEGNTYDAWISSTGPTTTHSHHPQNHHQSSNAAAETNSNIPWPPPSIERIYDLINVNPTISNEVNELSHNSMNDEKKEGDTSGRTSNTSIGRMTHEVIPNHQNQWYEYDDDHSSNLYRIYNHYSSNYEPLSLQQLVGIGLFALNQNYSSNSSCVGTADQQQHIQPLGSSSPVSSRLYYDTQLIFQQDEHISNQNCREINFTINPVFTSYFYAVLQKGYFHDCGTFIGDAGNTNSDTPTKVNNSMIRITNPTIYEEKFCKVVSKFRTKYNQNYLADTGKGIAAPVNTAYLSPPSEYYNYLLQQLSIHHEQHQEINNSTSDGERDGDISMVQGIPIPGSYIRSLQQRQCLFVAPPPPSSVNYNIGIQHDATTISSHMKHSTPPSIQPSDSMVSYFSTKTTGTNATAGGLHHQQQSKSQHQLPDEVVAAEKCKHMGNTFMQQKQYHKAIDCYTQALKHIVAVNGNDGGTLGNSIVGSSSNHNQAHVYYSNRAAAYISIKNFTAAIQDSERALMIQPTYGKGHARLGLAYFLSGQYRNAVEAYTVALKYDPNNTSSKNYLEKSAYRLAEQEQAAAGGAPITDISSGDGNVATGSRHTPSSTNVQQSSNSFSVISEMEHRSSNAAYSSPYNAKNASFPTITVPSPNDHMAAQLSTLPSPVIRSNNNDITDVTNTDNNQIAKEAERYKMKGNTFMSQKDYHNAIDSYGKAIQLLPNDPTKSHVYYSNRAAAFCYLECYSEAEHDASMAIQILPTYGKAYARLGLSRFLLKNYADAISAYETSLQYDPDNSASQSYLIKAQQKLQQQQSSSFSGNNKNNSTGNTESKTTSMRSARLSTSH